jgi:transcriptional regulator with XRE-family HTH domain
MTPHDDSFKTTLKIIAANLRALRIRKGYKSIEQFARDHGLAPIQYWRIEKGKANVSLKSLHRILAIHKVQFKDILETPIKVRKGKRGVTK